MLLPWSGVLKAAGLAGLLVSQSISLTARISGLGTPGWGGSGSLLGRAGPSPY